MPPRVFLTSDDPEFDEIILDYWKQEGFLAKYFPYSGDGKALKYWLQHVADELEVGESFALIGQHNNPAITTACPDQPSLW